MKNSINPKNWRYFYDFIIYIVFTIVIPIALVILQMNPAYSKFSVSTQSLIILFAVPYALGSAASTRRLRLIVGALILSVVAVILCADIFVLPDIWLQVSAMIVVLTGILTHLSIAFVRFITNKNKQRYI